MNYSSIWPASEVQQCLQYAAAYGQSLIRRLEAVGLLATGVDIAALHACRHCQSFLKKAPQAAVDGAEHGLAVHHRCHFACLHHLTDLHFGLEYPCRRGPQESACDWCPFASACWFDEKRDKPRYLQKTTPEEFWQMVDREEERHG